ncbi:DeoR/GlpR family DNA-binding transcription regulator [Streptococcus uberis]|uniref:DeoR/GlpR family DNA-binding transcription regulator n=1 Tax=Streptococcus uberis TaxID=1349 RepID=UPI0012B56633|nr:DeoR/GlpR family DNA-binding transcription regulator [Streptococcus uberis]MCK1198392.1 DeoR/GlpR family DNA-binding transcription regulator [Streptococcus uberis]MCR4257598.1 DeoR/GlpR family DNA-binding transcription regulator [Streptococcus uberis]MTB61665.1 DeoR family transcriptional regulator [Streptococcus uberis]MTB91610.1 DeoR family transcriptional regulator [Streptococcus uberis]
MLKRERLLKIIDKVNTNGIITVNEIMQHLKVSDMTARRDLDELEKAGKLVRIHGGAQSISSPIKKLEKSNTEKLNVQTKEKKEIASFAATLINDGETIFIGPGTTLEFFAEQLIDKTIRIVTNSLPVFDILKNSDSIDLILIGGEYRNITGAFVGSLTNQTISTLKFSKAFIGCNGIYKNDIATYNESEGQIQRIALNNAIEKILLVDNQKFNAYDFSVFYQLDQIDKTITDSRIQPEVFNDYKERTQLIIANQK